MWKKGQSGNPNGRPSKARDELNVIIKTVERRKRKKLLTHFVNRAYEDDTVLVALAKKILPDLRHVAGESSVPVRIILERADGTKRDSKTL